MSFVPGRSCFLHIVESKVCRHGRDIGVLLSAKEELGRAIAVGTGKIPPFIQRAVRVLARLCALAEHKLDILHGRLGQAIGLGVVWRSQLLLNVVGLTPLTERATELGAPVSANGRWPAQNVEPSS